MATIKSGADATMLNIDPVTNAAKVQSYDTLGNPIHPGYVGTYIAHVDVVPATTFTDGTTYWAVRNTGTRTCFVRRIDVTCSFTAPGLNSRSLFRFERFAVGSPASGTALPIAKRDNNSPNSSVGVALSANGGLTTSAMSFEGNSPLVFGMVNQQMTVPLFFDFSSGTEYGRFLLYPGEGLALRAYGTVVAGIGVHGAVGWDER